MAALPQPHHIALPEPNDRNKLAFTLDAVFTAAECEEMIKDTEQRGYIPALVNVGLGREVIMTDVRNNDRCIVDDVALADKIFQRVKHTLPETFWDRQLVSLNERLRFLRYYPGQKFEPHMDGTYVRPDNSERSCLTLQLYLNDACEGGSTRFLSWDGNRHVDVIPKIGQVLVFQQNILHSGSEVTKGIKYVMRTDVMYR